MFIRQVFSIFALVMLGLMVSRIYGGVWSDLNWAMFVVSLVACLLVFKVFVYVFNFSYAASCVINGTMIVVFLPSVASFLLGGLMVLYGLRLGAFSLARGNSESYAPRAANTRAADGQMPTPIKAALWLQCAFLYTFHLFAVYLVAQQGRLTASVVVAAVVIASGIVIEALADSQKQKAKAAAADKFVATGLFSRWRHPNYSGEILVQIGLIIAGVGAVSSGWANYLAVTISPLYIIFLMLSEASRADKVLQSRYGDEANFSAYWQSSGSLLPKF